MKRRDFLLGAGALALSPYFFRHAWAANGGASQYLMPSESAPHQATWMAYGATAGAWGTTGVYGMARRAARADLMRIAANLSRFEPVNMLVNPNEMEEARAVLAQVKSELAQSDLREYSATGVFTNGRAIPNIEAGGKINLIAAPLNDLWVRDTAPLFVRDENSKRAAVDFNFNGWGQADTGAKGWKKDPAKREHGIVDQPIGKDQKIAAFIAKYTHSPLVKTWLVMEGGGIEVDGKGNAICTESCILNDNRNPNRSKTEVEQELHRVLGVNNITWLKGLKARDITDAHIDFYARFTDNDSVLCAIDDEPESPDYAVTRDNLRVLKQHHRKVIELHAPNYETVQAAVEARQYEGFRFNENGFAAGYIGFYVANGCIVLPQFGDPDADREAFDIISQSHPDRTVLQIATDGIANGGGSIHCATQQEIPE